MNVTCAKVKMDFREGREDNERRRSGQRQRRAQHKKQDALEHESREPNGSNAREGIRTVRRRRRVVAAGFPGSARG